MQARQKLTPTSHFFYFYFWWDKGVIFIVNMITLPTYLYINIPPLIIYYSFLFLSIVFTLQAICLASVIWSLVSLQISINHTYYIWGEKYNLKKRKISYGFQRYNLVKIKGINGIIKKLSSRSQIATLNKNNNLR